MTHPIEPGSGGPGSGEPVVLSTFADAREAFRCRDLRQALYDEGHLLMSGVIVNLHGPAHRDRRRLENRLFRRDTFLYYQREVIPRAIGEVLAPSLAEGRDDLLPMARRTMMNLSAAIAGVDLPAGTGAEFDRLYGLMLRLQRGSTLVHATGDKRALEADGQAALAEFDEEFLRPSAARRRALIDRWRAGDLAEDDLPRDVLTTLLRNQDDLDLPPDVVRREVAYFPWVGSFSTSDAFVHAMGHVFEWLDRHPEDRGLLRRDEPLLQRFVHESLRLHPASPESRRVAVADVELRGGVTIPQGASVVIDLAAANRDPDLYGPTADEFDPFRQLPEEAAPWGLTFGTGFHACLGQELAGGLAPEAGADPSDHLAGAIVTMARILLEHGARPDPTDPPERDPESIRPHFGRYPVVFDPDLT
ncbi:MAG: cytochrome P450 [Actinomycetota bacterium]|nr:cytochrome P450 [Actinomycetota bacterium]